MQFRPKSTLPLTPSLPSSHLARLVRLPRRVVLLAGFLALVLYLAAGSSTPTNLAQPLYDIGTRATGTSLAVKHKVLLDQPDGTVVVRRVKGGEHPIKELMREAKAEWEAQLARQSTTFAQAVATYRKRYGRAPPKGFQAWWKFVKKHNVKIVDDYDEIFNSIAPFFALRPEVIAERLHQVLYTEPFSFRMSIRRSQPVSVAGERSDAHRPQLLADLIEGFRHALPADFGEGPGVLGEGFSRGNDGVVMWGGSDHDLGGHVMGEEFRERMMDLARRNEYIKEDELAFFENRDRQGSLPGLINACKADSPAARLKLLNADNLNDMILQPQDQDEVVRSRRKAITFLKEPVKSYDFCHNPALLPLHSTFSFDFTRDPTLLPQLVLSKYAQGNALLVTPLEAFSNHTESIPWKKKMIDKVFWRGSSTGDSYSARKDYDWRRAHRVRLHKLASAREGQAKVLVEGVDEKGRQQLRLKSYSLEALNDHLVDIGLSEINQCNAEDGTCAEMERELPIAGRVEPSEALHFKYALDVDGNGWSSRFRRLLASGNVVLKSTIFPEWNTQWLRPWVHYIPINIDYSDLYHVSSFFIGTPDGISGHDDLAREISEAAARFTEEHWRWVFRMLLEYRRVISTDRNAMSLDGLMWG